MDEKAWKGFFIFDKYLLKQIKCLALYHHTAVNIYLNLNQMAALLAVFSNCYSLYINCFQSTNHKKLKQKSLRGQYSEAFIFYYFHILLIK